MSDDTITRLNAALEGRYRIERKLGEAAWAGLPRILCSLGLIAALTACGQHHIIPTMAPVADTAPSLLPNLSTLGSVALVEILNRKARGSLVGYRVMARSDERQETFYYDPSTALACDAQAAVHDAFRARGITAPEHAVCPGFRAMPADTVYASLENWDAALRLEVVDLAWNEVRPWFAPFSVPDTLNCNAEAHLIWSIDAPAGGAPLFVGETRSRFEGRCRSGIPNDGLAGAARMAVAQLLAKEDFVSTLESLRGSHLERAVEEAARREAQAERDAIDAAERAQRESERRAAAVRDAAALEVARAARWRRPVPPTGAVIMLDASDRNPTLSGSVPELMRPAVVTIEGPHGSGAAFLISRDGLAITNLHVLQSPGDVVEGPFLARFTDGYEAPVRVLRTSESPDIALIQVLCEFDCETLEVSGSEPALGTEIYLAGSPRGLSFSISSGIVSSIRFDDGHTVLQTDAAANPGNSGGPMVSADTGEVLGVLTFGITNSEGLNFAISILDALRSVGVRIR